MDSPRGEGLRAVSVAGYPGVAAGTNGETGKPTVLWLHGITNTPDYCSPFLLSFAAAGYPALALARRGRLGVPPTAARGVTFGDYLEDSLRVYDALGAPAVVLGHSQGGLLALKLAEQRRPLAVVLLAPLPPRGIPAVSSRLDTLPAGLSSLVAILRGGAFRPTFRQASALFLNEVPRGQRRRLYDAGVADSALSLRPAYVGGVPVDPDRVRGPLLCISGGRDRTIPASSVARVARRYGGRWVNFPELGHEFCHEPGGPKVAERIIVWLDGALGAGTRS